MNIILAIGLLTGLFMVKFQKLAELDQRAVIGHVIKKIQRRPRRVCRKATAS